jgi:RNA polymerase sigma factor (sigma-70 family)
MQARPDSADTLKTRPTLLSKVRRGDEEGWNQFYELYEEFIYSAAMSAGLSHEESREIVQATMLTVRNYIGKFVPDKDRGRFRAWLRKIVRSRIMDEYRRRQRRPQPLPRAACDSDETATSATNRIPDLNEVQIEQLLDGKWEQAILAAARRLVKEKVRMEDYQAYDLFQIKELGAREVALSLGISPATVRVRSFRVRRAIQKEIRSILKRLEQPHFRRNAS